MFGSVLTADPTQSTQSHQLLQELSYAALHTAIYVWIQLLEQDFQESA